MGVTARQVSARSTPGLPFARRALWRPRWCRSGRGRLGLYSAVLAGVDAPASSIHVPWWILVALFFLAEAFPVHIHFRNEAHSLSLGELALVLALYLVSPGELLVAQLLGAAVALAVVRRQRPLTMAFNLAALASARAPRSSSSTARCSSGSAYGPAGWLGALLGAAPAPPSACAREPARVARLRAPAARRSSGRSPSSPRAGLRRREPRRRRRCSWVEHDSARPLGDGRPGREHRARAQRLHDMRRRQGHLEFLSRSMRAMQGAEFRSSVRELLEAARTMLSAEVAEIVVVSHSRRGRRAPQRREPDEELLMEPIELTRAGVRALRNISAHEAAALLPRGRQPRSARRVSRRGGARGRDRDRAARRRPRCSGWCSWETGSATDATFTHDDRRLFETFASHAAALLENDRVKSQLRHQAFHDSLTGFANRRLFAERVQEALHAPAAGDRRRSCCSSTSTTSRRSTTASATAPATSC